MDTSLSTNARKTDPISSHIAGHNVLRNPETEINLAKVLEAVKQNPNLTSRQLFDKTGLLDRHEIARRLPDLRKTGKVYVSGFGVGNQFLWSAL